MTQITLNCWIRSEIDRRIFQVTILQSKTVSYFQKAIKDQIPGTFPAYALDLYKPTHPVSRPYAESLSNLKLLEHGECLLELDELSAAFPEQPPQLDIHVIIDAPSKVNCWLRGSSLNDRFPISIQPGEDIDRFITRIKDKQPDLRNVADQRIRLYKISGDEKELREILDNTRDGELLQGDSLAPNFLGVSVLAPLRVVVEVAAGTRSTNPPPFLHSAFEGADPIAAARESFIKARPPKRSRSDSSKPSAFHETQGEREMRIPCGRPRDPEELIPVTLLHSVFGQFADDCHTGTMTADDNQFVGKLANIMSDLYKNEGQRVEGVRDVFKVVHINLDLSTRISGTNYKMDSSLSVDYFSLPPFLIGEFKNEMGSSTSEPFIQAVSYYLEATKMFAPKRSKFALPCFLLIVFGPYMVFAGAVWNLRPVVQVLSTPLAFNYHSANTRIQLTVARHMAAFRKALGTLKTYYEDLSKGLVKEHQSRDTLFPCYTDFQSLEDHSMKTIRYTNQLEEGSKKTRLIFFGTLEEDSTAQICIKFTQRYSKEAHLHCAESGFAPKLRGFEVLPGGWYMIVMDNLIDYDLLADLPDIERLLEPPLEVLEKQLKEMHVQQLVHGDIRDANIFVNKDRTKLMIIDFDWAGEIGVVLYPPYVNYTDVQRPKDARDGLPIKAAHDLEMLAVVTEAWTTRDS